MTHPHPHNPYSDPTLRYCPCGDKNLYNVVAGTLPAPTTPAGHRSGRRAGLRRPSRASTVPTWQCRPATLSRICYSIPYVK